MSVKIITQYWSHYNSGISRTEVRGVLEVDTLSDLPTMDGISGYRLTIGTIAHIIDTAAVYKMDSSGSWHVQEQGTDFYTKSQIDTMMAAKADAATTYTKTETDNLLATKADAANVYTKTETDNLLAPKITMDQILGMGVAIETGDDLNDDKYKTPGAYRCQTVTIANTLTNTPISGTAFKLIVEIINNNNPLRIRQTIYPMQNDSRFYTRSFTSNGWQSWYLFQGTPV